MDYSTAIATARTRLEESAFAMRPVDAAPALRAAVSKVADYAACTVMTKNWPVLDDDAGWFALTALGASIGLTGETYRFFTRQISHLLEDIARKCDRRAVMARGYIDYAVSNIASGRAMTLDGVPPYLLRDLVDSIEISDPVTVAALLASLKAARANDLGLEVLRSSAGVFNASQTKAMFDLLDSWTRDWIIQIAFDAPVMQDVG